MASSSILPWRDAPLRRFDALILGAVTLSTGTLVGRPDMALATLVVIDFYCEYSRGCLINAAFLD